MTEKIQKLGIQCPYPESAGSRCEWSERKGSYRDYKKAKPLECRQCGIVSPTIDLSFLVDYPNGSMESPSSSVPDSIFESDLERRISETLTLYSPDQNTTILDFGCGNGDYLKTIAQHGFAAIGVEPDRTALCHDDKTFRTLLNLEELVDLNLEFDLITLFHVIEHLYAPLEILKTLKSILKPNGFLIVETPNSMDGLLTKYENRAFQQHTYWSHHPVLYSAKALSELLSRVGFEEIRYTGVQRYGLANHLYWLSHAKPGGHEVWNNMISPETEILYERDLLQLGLQDTLWFVARKSK